MGTKYSGLSAVTAFADTQEWGVNDGNTSKKITGAQLRAALPQGTLPNGYAAAITSQGSITNVAVDLTNLTVTVTPSGSGRRWRISCQVELQSTVAGDIPVLTIMEGATQLQRITRPLKAAAASETFDGSVVVQPTNAQHIYKLQLVRAVGTGTLSTSSAATVPSFILVEDIGV